MQTAREIARDLRDLAEVLESNELMEPQEAERLRRDVADPLEEIARQELPQSAQELRALANEPSSRTLEDQMRRDVEKIAEELHELAAKLGSGTTVADVIGRLEGILELQEEAIQETGKKVEGQTGGADGLRSF